jgi:hypothetical protein
MHQRVKDLDYVPQNFRDLAETPQGVELWAFLREHDNVVRMETATWLERAAIEPLAAGLVERFGAEVGDDRTKQMIGHMVRQVMAAIGYEPGRSSVRITRPSLFTSATAYKIKGSVGREMKITREQREAWVKNTKDSPFNLWLNAQVRTEDGALDLDKLYAVASRYGLEKRYDHLNPGQQRMNIGVQLAKIVDPSEYSASR